MDLSKYHDLLIDKGLLNGDLIPDVTMLQTSNDFEDWKARGVLERYKPAGFDAVRDEFRTPTATSPCSGCTPSCRSTPRRG